METPDFAEGLAYVVVGEEVGGIVELGDFGNVVTQGGGNSVVEGFAVHFQGIVPAHGDFITSGAQVGCVFLGSAFTIDVRKGHGLGKHVLRVPDIGIGRNIQPVLEKAQVQTDVVGNDGLPGESAGNGGRHGGSLGGIRSVEGIGKLGQGDGVEVVVIAHLLVAQGTIAQTELGLVPGILDGSPEGLLTDTPAGRCGGEEAPAVILREAGSSVVAAGDFQEVLLCVVIIDTAEEA